MKPVGEHAPNYGPDEGTIKQELQELVREEQELEAQLKRREELREKKEQLTKTLEEIESKKSPYDRGHDAFLAGTGLSDCPYYKEEERSDRLNWIQGWVDTRISNTGATNTVIEVPADLEERLKAAESALEALQKPQEDLGEDSLEKRLKKAENRISAHADNQIRRARRYIVAVAAIAILFMLIPTVVVSIKASLDETVAPKVDQVEQVAK